ncbi:hypothetical protein HDE77_001877 [Rhodanobacter sp. MP7CTX1]|nr:hypothetical protein [Rhodanobacter sp. MP7CTX1]
MGSNGIVMRADRDAESLGKDWAPLPLGPRQVVGGLLTEFMEGAVELRFTASLESVDESPEPRTITFSADSAVAPTARMEPAS